MTRPRLTLAYFLPVLLLTMCLLMLPTQGNAQFDRDEITVIHESYEGPMHFFDGDGDGDFDVLKIVESANGNLLYFENTDPSTPGSYNPPIHSGDTVWWNYPKVNSTKCLIGDMDEDGLPDAVMLDRIQHEQPFFKNQGNGHFTHPAGLEGTVTNANYHFEIGHTTTANRLDLIIYDSGNQQLFINRNQGLGVFALEEIAFTLPIPTYDFKMFKIMDFDNDGLDDLVFMFYNLGTTELIVAPYQSNGETFVAMPLVVIPSMSTSFFTIKKAETQDMNSDGYPDLSLTLEGCFLTQSGGGCANNLLLVLNNDLGSGDFTEVGKRHGITSSLVVDINADGQMEVVVLNKGATPDAYEVVRIENGFFAEIIPIELSEIDPNTEEYLSNVADLNQDGYPEVLINNWQYPSINGSLTSLFVSFFENQANGEVVFSDLFTLAPFNADHSNFKPQAHGANRLIDWDADGDLDFLMVGKTKEGKNGVFMLRNQDGLGQYSAPELIWSSGYDFMITDFKMININDDGLIDFISIVWPAFGSAVNGKAALGISDAQTGTYNTSVINENNTLFFSSSLADDLDNDGDNDLLLPQVNGSFAVAWNELAVNGGFDFESNYIDPIPFTPSNQMVLFEDINQDGHKDIAVQTGDGAFNWAYQLEDSGTFEDWQTLEVEEGILASHFPMMLDDFNGDGYLDVAFPPVLQSFYDPETNNFQAARPINIFNGSAEVPAAADINMDGTADLISEEGVSLSSPETGYLTAPFLPIQTPNGKMPDPIFYDQYSMHHIGDIDGDGILEVVFGEPNVYAYNLDFLPASSVQGYLRQDTSLTCTYDEEALPLANWVIAIENDTLPQTAITNSDGFYGALLPDTLSYLIRPIPPNAYWEACPPDTLLQAPLPIGVNAINFVIEPVIECALLDVEITSSQIRQCFNSFVPVHYTNVGTITLPDAQIEISFDQNLTPVNSTLPWDIATDSTLVFSLNDVGVGEQGNFTIEFMPNCEDLTLGETICFTTSVTPDSLCQDLSLNWNGANLEAMTICENDSLAFIISNTGEGDMQAPQPLQIDIINDDIVIFLIDDTELDAGESDTIRVAAMDQVMRLHADQPLGHPLPEPINLLAQGCAVEEMENLGLTFPSEEGNPFVNTFCLEVIGSFDPNIKTAIPEGLGDSHLIEKDWTIDYTIQFQNTGTDHARNVSIRDTLSPLLDLTSFKFKGASHNVDVQLLPNRELFFSLKYQFARQYFE